MSPDARARTAALTAGMIAGLGGLLAGTSCTSDPGSPSEHQGALDVEWSGCAELWAGPVCELPMDGALTLWINAGREAEISVQAGARQLEVTRDDVQSGTRIRVTVPREARDLLVVRGPARNSAVFRMTLAPPSPVPGLIEADALRKDGKFEQARAKVEPLLRDASPRVRARALGKIARILFAEGHVDEALAGYREAEEADRAVGLLSGEAEDRFAHAYALLYRKRSFAGAARALDPVRALVPSYGVTKAKLAFNEGQLAYETGDLRAAQTYFRTAEAGSERLGLDTLKLDAQTQQLIVLHDVGRTSEGLRATLAREANAATRGDCARAGLKTNLGWSILRQTGDDSSPPQLVAEAIGWLSEAAALYRDRCRDPFRLANTVANLAAAELARGSPADARVHIDEARRSARSRDVRVETLLLEVEARIALTQGSARDALAKFEQLAAIAGAAQLVDKQLAAAGGLAESLEALGRTEDAKEAYQRAEQELDRWTRLVPLGRDRDAFLACNEQVSLRHIDFLVRRGWAAEAADMARRSRSRSLVASQWSAEASSLDDETRGDWYKKLDLYREKRDALEGAAKDDWTLSRDQIARVRAERERQKAELNAAIDVALSSLPSKGDPAGALIQPTEGQVFLIFHPIRNGWAGFAMTSDLAVRQEIVEAPAEAAPEVVATTLLARLRPALDTDSVEKIRLLAYGALDRIDLHALPVDDRPLLAIAPVEYGLDLPRSVAGAAGKTRAAALVVSDPSNNLVTARREGESAAGALRDRLGYQVEHLRGAETTPESVRKALEHPDVDYFHYAGHGRFDETDQQNDTALLLADSTTLSLNDILTLRRAPRFVVLSGCETARSADGARAVGAGIAQAFVLRGADVVVAARTTVDDEATGRIMGTFYRALEKSGPADMAAALRAAELEEMRREPSRSTGAWARFRIVVP